MAVQTEKMLYERDVMDELRDINPGVILWGEDLYDASIVVYPKKLSDAIPDSYQWKYLKKATLVYFNFKSDNYVRTTGVKWDEENRAVYLSAGNFESVWKYLKKSVKKGILNNPDQVGASANPKDIVDLECFCTDTKIAYIKEDKIAYKSKEISEEALKLMGKKQSALDNPKNRFFYSASGSGYYHVKDCEVVKDIKPVDFLASPDIPDGRTPCHRCRRRIYLRIICDPYVRQINIINRMLMNYGIRDSKLELYALTYGFKFRLGDEGELYVTGAEDTWIIKGFDVGKFSLWHNNYVMTGPRERAIVSGFHNQEVESRNLNFIFDFIHNYSFEAHFDQEPKSVSEMNEKLDTELGEIGTRAGMIETEDLGSEKLTSDKKTIFSRIAGFFRRVFGKG